MSGSIEDLLKVPAWLTCLPKLARAPPVERHAFVPMSFKGAPISVFTYLDTDQSMSPDTAQDLPLPHRSGLDGVPLRRQDRGDRWDGQRWSRSIS